MKIDESDNEKKISYNLDSIKNFEQESAYIIDNHNNGLHNEKALLCKKGDHYELKVIADLDNNVEVFKNPTKPFGKYIKLQKNENYILIPVNKIRRILSTLSSPAIITYKAYEVFEPYEGNKFLRAIYLIDERPELDGFPLSKVKIGPITHYKCFEVKLNHVSYQVFFHKNDDLNLRYLFIETSTPTNIHNFEESINSIIYTISLFTGKFYRGGRYIVALDDYEESWKGKQIKYEYLGESILNSVSLLDTHTCKTILEKLGASKDAANDKCKWMTSEMLNNIITNIHKNNKIYRVIDLINEGNSTSSLILKSSIYSIALETLTNLVYEENKEKLNPISDNQLEETIKEKFFSILDEYEHSIGKYGMNILKKKVTGLNRPANVDKLVKSFSAIGLRISQDDERVIKYRNKFLHGSSPIRNFEGNDDKTSELYYIASHLHKLTTLLLLKFIGYRGHVKNLYAINYYEHKRELKESPILII